MAIKRNSCRISERKKMREMAAQGFSIPQISNQVSVKENVVSDVLDGTWAKAEAKQKKAQKALDAKRADAEENKEVAQAAAIAAATAKAIKDAEKVEAAVEQEEA
jgi:hypothetical protein